MVIDRNLLCLIHNAIRQGCVFAHLLFIILMAIAIHKLFHDCVKDISVNVWYEHRVYNLLHLEALTKVYHMLVRDLHR